MYGDEPHPIILDTEAAKVEENEINFKNGPPEYKEEIANTMIVQENKNE